MRYGITSPASIGNGESNRIGPETAVPMCGILHRASFAVAKIPGPGDNGSVAVGASICECNRFSICDRVEISFRWRIGLAGVNGDGDGIAAYLAACICGSCGNGVSAVTQVR